MYIVNMRDLCQLTRKYYPAGIVTGGGRRRRDKTLGLRMIAK